MEASSWPRPQPLASAPRDGTEFLAWITGVSPGWIAAHYTERPLFGKCWGWDDGYTAKVDESDGWWIPMPPDPTHEPAS